MTMIMILGPDRVVPRGKLRAVDRTGVGPFLTGGTVLRSEIKWCDASQCHRSIDSVDSSIACR